MERIESFNVDHTRLMPGLYVSRIDRCGGVAVTTFDLRFLPPNRAEVYDTGTMHTVEHIAATYLRNSKWSESVVYFGPMGCRTGFYLVLLGELKPTDILSLVRETMDYTARFEGGIPGATAVECGNYTDQNLEGAKAAAKAYSEELEYQRFVYPGGEFPREH